MVEKWRGEQKRTERREREKRCENEEEEEQTRILKIILPSVKNN